MAVISCHNIEKRYGDVLILQDVSFAVEEGSFSMLIGPNGSGKTTLLHILLGELKADTGTVEIFGEPPAKAAHRIGYVPQRFGFDRSIPLTVQEFLSLVTTNTKKHKDILQTVGLTDKYTAQVGKLSGGELQRLLIARTLLEDKDVLLLDEPTANIDASGEATFYELLEQLRQERGLTILLVTHELDFVHEYADNVLCLHQCLHCSGRPAEVLQDEHIQKVFGKNMRRHHHHH